MSFYNTNNENNSEKKKSEIKARSQEEIIFQMFKNQGKLSASDAWSQFDNKERTPITSIRRAITNLCKDNLLEKTKDTKIGLFGKKEHWRRLIDCYKIAYL